VTASGHPDDTVLVGIVKTPRDVTIIDSERWYRIPVSTVRRDPKDWPPKWFAAFEPIMATRSGQQILRYARVREVEEKSREELFPGEPAGDKAGNRYYQLHLEEIRQLPEPLRPRRTRRNPFIHTTLGRLETARDFNDLFSDATEGGYEDRLWRELEAADIPAERQWPLTAARKRKFVLDFAVFCRNRTGLDIEVDGKRHHYLPEQSEYDSDRNNLLTTKGWSVLRFRTAELRESLRDCLSEIAQVIERKGGLEGDPVPRKFIPMAGGFTAQLQLLEDRESYDRPTGG
jgi:very-short-patch-repair endonuclease